MTPQREPAFADPERQTHEGRGKRPTCIYEQLVCMLRSHRLWRANCERSTKFKWDVKLRRDVQRIQDVKCLRGVNR
jgi:hypothetical protein